MRKESWKKITKIFDQALELNTSEQQEFVENLSQGDTEIFSQVMKMLQAGNNLDFMSDYPGKINTDNIELGIPKQLGHFKVLKKIATGGMGRVYLGQSTTSDVVIKVALKTIRIELISDELKQKFQNEKNILSQLKHKNIASLIDAGISNEQIPYIATEWVSGLNIKTYCAKFNLSIKQRLKLFLQICEAMKFAHNKLIIHRDLKPDNILVNNHKQVKLLDFGIAKIMDENKDAQTQTQIFTPDYAAPEQLNGEICSAATDIYSLGIILFEILSNSKRFNLTGLGIAEKIKAIAIQKQADLSDVQADESLPYSLKQIKGALFNIINKAMHVEPNRRYDSVSSLMTDIVNYTNNRPITAMKDSFIYKAKMLLLRNKLASGFLALAFLGITMGLVIANKQLVLKAKEEKKSQAMLNFFDNIMATASPEQGGSLNMTVREMFIKGINNFDLNTLDDSYVKAEIVNKIGLLYSELGQQKESAQYLQIARDYYEKNLSEENNASLFLESALQIANSYIKNNEEAKAKSIITHSLKKVVNYSVKQDVMGLAYILLARIYGTYGTDFSKETAFSYFDNAELILLQLNDKASEKFKLLGEIYFYKQHYFYNTNTYSEALNYLNKADFYFSKTANKKYNPKINAVMTTKADLFSRNGQLKKAQEYFKKGNQYYYKMFARYNYITLANQAKNYYKMGNFSQSLTTINHAEDIFNQDKKARNLNYYILLRNKANAFVGMEDYTNVQEYFSEILEYMYNNLSENKYLIKTIINYQANFYLKSKNVEGIIQSKQSLLKFLGNNNLESSVNKSDQLSFLINLATIYFYEENYEAALNYYQQAQKITVQEVEKHNQGWLYWQLVTGLELSKIKLKRTQDTSKFQYSKEQLLNRVSHGSWYDDFFSIKTENKQQKLD